MRLSIQHRQILLVLLRNNPRALRLERILRPVIELKRKKWILSTEEDKLPRPRVISASFCRSLKTLGVRGLATKEVGYYGEKQWRLTAEGLATAREIKRELERQIEELSELLSLHEA